MKKSELRQLIRESIQEVRDEKQYVNPAVNEIAFTKKGKWQDAIKKAGGADKVPPATVDQTFNSLLSPENKKSTGIGAYAGIFKKVVEGITNEQKIAIIDKILNSLPSDDYLLVPASQQDAADPSKSSNKEYLVKVGSAYAFLKGINKQKTSSIHGFGGGAGG